MEPFPEYEDYDALGLAELVRDGEVTAEELLDAAIARAEARNPAVNAIVDKLYDHGRRAIAAGLPDGPFTGVPYLLKDIGGALGGHAQTRGSRFFDDFTPPRDSVIVERGKRAGLVIFGKTNTPELGLSLTCEPQLFGPSRNPWDRERTPGGSSGGSAAAVAAHIAPMASGGDGFGSIRAPASCCGLGRGLIIFDMDTDCGESDCGEEVPGELVVAGGDASEVFEFVEEPLDQIALAIERGIDAVPDLAVLLGRDVGLGAMLGDQIADRLGVVAAVADRVLRRVEAGQQVGNASLVGGLTGGEQELDRQAAAIDHDVNLGAQSATRTTDGVIRAPFFPPAAC